MDEVNVTGLIGCMLAMTLSWSENKSVLWCILHGIFSWFYVIYYLIKDRIKGE